MVQFSTKKIKLNTNHKGFYVSILSNFSLKNATSGLSKMWIKILNLENSTFALKEELRVEELSHKEQKFIKILDFAQIEKNITVVSITNTPKDREEIARAFIAKRRIMSPFVKTNSKSFFIPTIYATPSNAFLAS